MKKTVFFQTAALVVTALMSLAAVAQESYSMSMAHAFEYSWIRPKARRLGNVPTLTFNSPNTPTEERGICEETYRSVLNRGEIEIRIAFGYMDISEGKPYLYDRKDFGNAAAIDLFSKKAMRDALTTRRCSGELKACGFSEVSPDVFTKNIKGPRKEKVRAVVRLVNGSLTPFYEETTGILASEQSAHSASADDFFFGGIGEADALFYVGHSRNGGGPDFHPPRLMSNGKVNYKGYYEVKRPGANRLISALRSTSRPPLLLGMLSCLSEWHFGRELSKAAPYTGLMLTDSKEGLVGYDEALIAAVTGIDGLLRMQCRTGFQNELQASAPKNLRIQLRQFLGSGGPQPQPPNKELIAH